NAVFERRNDLAARRIILRIRAEHQGNIERQADGVAFDLHVAFLHDVEQTDLDLSRQIRQFINSKDAAIGAGQQAVMYGVLAGQVVSAAGGLDGINVADEVGNGDVRGGQLFNVTLLYGQIVYESFVFLFRNHLDAARANGSVRIV